MAQSMKAPADCVTLETTGVKEMDTQRSTRAPMMNIPRMEAPSVTLPIRPPERSLAMEEPSL